MFFYSSGALSIVHLGLRGPSVLPMRIMLLGDTHRNEAFARKAFEHARRLDCEEIIQLGDFGFGWNWLPLTDTLAICRFSAAISLLVEEFAIAFSFIDGNHENFDRLVDHPLGVDGRREVAPGVWHMPRGYRFERDSVSFLTCGGAVSVDRLARTESVSWWAAEAVTPADVTACGSDAVDILLTHDAPITSAFFENVSTTGYGIQADIDVLRNKILLEKILTVTQPTLTVHGHVHRHFVQDLGSGRRMIALAHDRAALHRAALVLDTRLDGWVEFLNKPLRNVLSAEKA